jgi:hypothetical protein
MSYDLLLRTAKNLWQREWSKAAPRSIAGLSSAVATVSPAMIASLVDLVAEDPKRPATELEPIIQRMLFESSFVDDGGDSVMFDAFDQIDLQARVMAQVLEEVRRQALDQGIWSVEPAAPMMFG